MQRILLLLLSFSTVLYARRGEWTLEGSRPTATMSRRLLDDTPSASPADATAAPGNPAPQMDVVQPGNPAPQMDAAQPGNPAPQMADTGAPTAQQAAPSDTASGAGSGGTSMPVLQEGPSDLEVVPDKNSASVAVEEDVQYFIFGYGSLLEKFSRVKTDCAIQGIGEFSLGAIFQEEILAVPGTNTTLNCSTPLNSISAARVSGIQRGWYSPGVHINPALKGAEWADNMLFLVPTYLGAYETTNSDVTCNGIIYPVSPSQYAATVQRELASNYTLVELKPERITVLGGPALPSNAKVVYFSNYKDSITLPTRTAPIVQSYVDITLGGAIELQDQYNLTAANGYSGKYPNFVEELVGTTRGWSSNWLNDRLYPYRPFVFVPLAGRISTALYNQVPKEILQNIKFVPAYSAFNATSPEVKDSSGYSRAPLIMKSAISGAHVVGTIKCPKVSKHVVEIGNEAALRQGAGLVVVNADILIRQRPSLGFSRCNLKITGDTRRTWDRLNVMEIQCGISIMIILL
eukprot:jgi/Botrbrau1/6971/Bobra.0165s0009.1